MRDLFEDIFTPLPIDPRESVRKAMGTPLRRRFYRDVGVGKNEEGFAVLLDGRPVRTPARCLLAAPTEPLALALAAEWDAVGEAIEPARMPLTRLANSILDGVAQATAEVRAEIEKYAGADLVFYRADEPEGLVTAQARHWDPIVTWAHEVLGARFILAQGVMFVTQPERALAAVRAALPDDAWRLGALHSATTITGSALIALALLHGRVSAEEAWNAAHVDEDWNMAQWGRDEMVMRRRETRWGEMQAAASVLDALRAS
jgi:chaperone required for assembly of F1-ATPase